MHGRILLSVFLLTTLALAGCSNNKDSDGDGLPDSVERRGWDIPVYLMDHVEVRHVNSDPKKVDTDGDGLSDFAETYGYRTILGFLDPSSRDTDGDGLSDCQEILHTVLSECEDPDFNGPFDQGYGTDPLAMDSDQSGVSRYNNVYINDGHGYQDPIGHRLSNGIYLYGDGISDYDELFGYDVILGDGRTLHGVTSDPLNLDSDEDGLEDGEEVLFGADPRVADTDDDGCLDGRDPLPARRETYTIQVGSFTLHESQDVDGANLVLQGVIAETAAFYPETGSRRVEADAITDIQDLTPDAIRVPGCGTSLLAPYFPWMYVEVAAYHKQEGAPDDNGEASANAWLDVLDIGSDQGLEPTIHFWWNVRDASLRSDLPREEGSLVFYEPQSVESPVPVGPGGWVTVEGVDGTFVFRPAVA